MVAQNRETDKTRAQSVRTHEPGTCRRIRRRMGRALTRWLGPEASWVRNHLAQCPRCRRRIQAAGRVELALTVLKSRPQSLALLRQANARAVHMLKHSLRETPKAEQLQATLPGPTVFEKLAPAKSAAGSIAACVALVLLTKTGLFCSVRKVERGGQQLIRQYYATQAGDDLVDNVF